MDEPILEGRGEHAKANGTLEPAGGSSPNLGGLADSRCPSCGAATLNNTVFSAPVSYVYALGKIEPRFPTPSIEKEFAQVVGREETKGLTDPQVLHKVLSVRHNRYLVRSLCWVFSVEGLDTIFCCCAT